VKRAAVFIGLFSIPILALLFLNSADHRFVELPYYGPKTPFDTVIDGKTVVDTNYFQIPPFSFTNQDGNTVTQNDVKGHIYVANFFFTKCPTICPVMTAQLTRVAKQAEEKGFDDFLILSHTIDPRNDTPEALKNYAVKYFIDTEKWWFLRGSEEYTHDFARSGYFLGAEANENAPGGFMHSEMVMLIDRQGHIRGIYKGTDTEAVNLLIDEIKVLSKEQPAKDK